MIRRIFLVTNFFPSLGDPATLAAWFLGSYIYHGLGITLGYHRLLTHKSLSVPRWLMYLVCSGGYLCMMGAPIVWVGVHRLHHQKSDAPGDPHSPVQYGFKHALYGWMLVMEDFQSDEEMQTQCRDLMKDPLMRWLGDSHDPRQAALCLGIGIAFRAIILAVFGLGPCLMNILATVIVFWSTQFVNTFCHMRGWGYRLHETRDDSLNVWWVAILTLGEGWHNNHHAMPTSARHGMAWWEVDITWCAIWLFEKLGLGQKVVRPTARLLNPGRNPAPVPMPVAMEERLPEPAEMKR
jgi:sn-1 stearoyl-lipid 9-desaturase